MQKRRAIKPGAGFVIVKKVSGKWKYLGLKVNGYYDLPKGEAEKDDQGINFLTAQRECFEECGILISEKNLKWGNSKIKLGALTLLIAETDQDPIIRKNKKTGIYEHESAEWLDFEELEKNIYTFLLPGIKWARTIIKC